VQTTVALIVATIVCNNCQQLYELKTSQTLTFE